MDFDFLSEWFKFSWCNWLIFFWKTHLIGINFQKFFFKNSFCRGTFKSNFRMALVTLTLPFNLHLKSLIITFFLFFFFFFFFFWAFGVLGYRKTCQNTPYTVNQVPSLMLSKVWKDKLMKILLIKNALFCAMLKTNSRKKLKNLPLTSCYLVC